MLEGDIVFSWALRMGIDAARELWNQLEGLEHGIKYPEKHQNHGPDALIIQKYRTPLELTHALRPPSHRPLVYLGACVCAHNSTTTFQPSLPLNPILIRMTLTVTVTVSNT